MDFLSIEQRSFIMSRVRSKDTKPEIIIRRLLFALGYRFRIHQNSLPGKPDIVLAKYKSVIFVNGCFWNLHKRCRDGRLPESKLTYWRPKLQKNVKRDELNYQKLKGLGWNVIKSGI